MRLHFGSPPFVFTTLLLYYANYERLFLFFLHFRCHFYDAAANPDTKPYTFHFFVHSNPLALNQIRNEGADLIVWETKTIKGP